MSSILGQSLHNQSSQLAQQPQSHTKITVYLRRSNKKGIKIIINRTSHSVAELFELAEKQLHISMTDFQLIINGNQFKREYYCKTSPLMSKTNKDQQNAISNAQEQNGQVKTLNCDQNPQKIKLRNTMVKLQNNTIIHVRKIYPKLIQIQLKRDIDRKILINFQLLVPLNEIDSRNNYIIKYSTQKNYSRIYETVDTKNISQILTQYLELIKQNQFHSEKYQVIESGRVLDQKKTLAEHQIQDETVFYIIPSASKKSALAIVQKELLQKKEIRIGQKNETILNNQNKQQKIPERQLEQDLRKLFDDDNDFGKPDNNSMNKILSFSGRKKQLQKSVNSQIQSKQYIEWEQFVPVINFKKKNKAACFRIGRINPEKKSGQIWKVEESQNEEDFSPDKLAKTLRKKIKIHLSRSITRKQIEQNEEEKNKKSEQGNLRFSMSAKFKLKEQFQRLFPSDRGLKREYKIQSKSDKNSFGLDTQNTKDILFDETK